MKLDDERLFNMASWAGEQGLPPYQLAQYLATILGHVLRDVPDERIFATNQTKRDIAVDEIVDLIYETIRGDDDPN